VRHTSPLAAALQRVGDRWTLLLVAELLDGPKRFGELQEVVPGIATNVLSSRLRELERHGLIVASPYSRRPLRFEYELSRAGAELAGALRMLAAWGATSEPPTATSEPHIGDAEEGAGPRRDGRTQPGPGASRGRPGPRREDSGAGADPAELLAPVHSACGTPLEVRHWCPTCQLPASDDEEVWV
jgi:DNA-binding HxlR family transcriptional regulator